MQTALDNTNGIEVSAMLALWQNIKTDRLENYQSTCLSMTHWQPEPKNSSSLEFGSSLFMASIYGDDEDVNDSGDDDDDDILSHAGLSSPPCPSAQTAPG